MPETNEWFATTHWSVVLAAKTDDAERAGAALEKLCRTYWRLHSGREPVGLGTLE